MRYLPCLLAFVNLALLLEGCDLFQSAITPGDQPPLQGSIWTIISMHGTAEVANRYGSTLTVDEESHITGRAACNTYSGSVNAAPGQGEVQLDVKMITEANCHDGGYETELLDVLESAFYYDMQDGQLALYGQESNRLLTFSEQ